MSSPYDAVLLVSFGGPRGPQEVMPFLRRVTAGRDVPDERLAVVARQYDVVGGVSPISAQTEALRAALAAALPDLPVLLGTRNGEPFLADTLAAAHAAGIRRLLAVLTSAYPSYSGCRQYREDLAAAAEAAGVAAELHIDRVRHYGDTPGFVDAMVDSARAALAEVPDGSRLVFTAHSIPVTMAASSGPDGDGYVTRLRDTAGLIADRLGRGGQWDLVFQSRSGPPQVAWLEPDIGDHLETLAAQGAPGAVMVPIGFVSDHMEVVYDLDIQATARARDLGLPVARASTVGTDPRFVGQLAVLVRERIAREQGDRAAPVSLSTLGPSPDTCPAGCCPGRSPRPTVAGG